MMDEIKIRLLDRVIINLYQSLEVFKIIHVKIKDENVYRRG